ncbi:hypothetical protein [Nocardiopsis sp. NPDC058789]|uniref:hypothetical protein n=1 Tax=Nocardiopsis sp. NPDC058789 TaxID=3346634 RepID=UPI00366D47B9
MPSPSGPPNHASTRLLVGSIMAASLGYVLWSCLTLDHPLRTGSPFSLCALVLVVLCVVLFAALPQRSGAPPEGPGWHAALVWIPWPFALGPLVLVSSEPGLLPWLWPLLLLPLTALVLVFLSHRARRRSGPDRPRGYATRPARSFGTAALTTALVSITLHLLLTSTALKQGGPSFSLVLCVLVAVLVTQILLGVARALPARTAGTEEPRADGGAVFVWVAWPMVLVAALPTVTNLIHPDGASSLWPLGLFPLGALGFAVLSTRAFSRERAERVKEGGSA